MEGPPLPRYPLASDERPDPGDRRIDWPLVVGRLPVRGSVVGFVALVLFTVALYLNGRASPLAASRWVGLTLSPRPNPAT
jgi:hypothetical protein